MRDGGSINGNGIRRVAQELVAEIVGVRIIVKLCVDIILKTDVFLTGSQTKQIADEVDYSIGASILFSTLLLTSGSSGDKLE